MSDLITLARAKKAIRNPDPGADSFIETLIDGASDAVRRYCRRDFDDADRDELQIVLQGIVQLRRFPVLSIAEVAADAGPAFAIRQSGAAVSRATATLSSTGLILSRTAGGVEVIDDSLLWSAEPTLAELAAAVIALWAGWSAEAKSGCGGYSSADLRPLSLAIDCLAQAGEFRTHRLPVEIVDFDADAGIVRIPSRWHGAEVRVRYSAGFATVPEDVQQAAALLVADWYAQSLHDPVLRWQEDAGGSTSRFASFGLPMAVVNLLQTYRDLAS